jgi:hypothetical protein
MPWTLVVALLAGVGFAIFSSAPTPARITAAPPPLPAEPHSDPESDDEPQMAASAEEPPQATLTGIVREHVDVSQYTYLHLATDAGNTWAAVYRAPVKNGALVTVEHASAIHGFHSTELGRDFDEIWFGVLPGHEHAPAPGAAASADHGSRGPDVPPAPSTAAPSPSAPTAKGGSASRATMPIADLAKGAASLDGKVVTVAGRVVKENDGILDRNWIHLQDGSGSAADGTNDVLVTTDVTAKVGDQLIVTGTLRTNQDFGSGYAYKFMIEKASVHPPAAP